MIAGCGIPQEMNGIQGISEKCILFEPKAHQTFLKVLPECCERRSSIRGLGNDYPLVMGPIFFPKPPCYI
jgi:hypothetical protein